MTAKNIAFSLIGLVLLGAISWSIKTGPLWKRSSDVGDEPSIAASGSGTKSALSGINYGYVPRATGTPSLHLPQGRIIPNLDREIRIPSDFLPDIAVLANEKIRKITAVLKENPDNSALWLSLGLERKGINDFTGSAEAFEYALALSPQNAVVADNLGVLYGYYVKDLKKAEQRFLLALKLEPETIYRYMRLYEFYVYILKDTEKAKDILTQGLQAHPGEPSLTALLEELK